MHHGAATLRIAPEAQNTTELQHQEYCHRHTRQRITYNTLKINEVTCNGDNLDIATPNSTKSSGKHTNPTLQSSEFKCVNHRCSINDPNLSSVFSTPTQARWLVATKRDNATAHDAIKIPKYRIFIKDINKIENQGKYSILTLWNPHVAPLLPNT